jgi:hypothetical protein
MDSATDHDPPSTTVLLATAEVQEFLEGIKLSFQPDDAAFANTIHNELHHELYYPSHSRGRPPSKDS